MARRRTGPEPDPSDDLVGWLLWRLFRDEPHRDVRAVYALRGTRHTTPEYERRVIERGLRVLRRRHASE